MRKFGWILLVGVAVAGVATARAPVGVGNEAINYTYDARGRLIEVEHSGSVNNNLKGTYTYDKADNRLNLNVTGSPN